VGECPVTEELYSSITGRKYDGDPNHPATSVSWWDAIKFCNARSLRDGLTPAYNEATGEIIDGTNGWRLPSEKQWEQLCRAGTKGDSYGDLDEIAVHSRNEIEKVRTKRPNAWGLHDTLGLVWEWCDNVWTSSRE
jgi:formylglycine-generating enzyme